MALSPQDHANIEKALAAAREGTLSEEQARQLADCVKNSDEFAWLYVQLAHLEASLRWDFAAGPLCLQGIEPDAEHGSPSKSGVEEDHVREAASILSFLNASLVQSHGGFATQEPTVRSPHLLGSTGAAGYSSWWRTMSVFALGAVAAVVAMALLFRSRPDQPSVAVAPAAYLISNTGCAWGTKSLRLENVGSSVQFGDEIGLQEGIAEFRLANGVFVSVEGPAGLVLTSSDSLVLQYGKLTTIVPWSVSEFKVSAGPCRLAASGAEYGVNVAGGRVETHVFSGDVLVSNALILAADIPDNDDNPATPAASPNEMFVKSAVSQGRSLTLAIQQGVMKLVRSGKASPSLFATKLTMAGPLPVSKAYIDAVMTSAPKGYWRFESAKNGVVKSEVSGIGDLRIIGDLRLSGLAGNRVAEFWPGANCCLVSGEPMDLVSKTDYTAEFWMKPSHVHSADVLALCATDKEWNALLIELEGAGSSLPKSSFSRTHPFSIRFTHRDPPGGSYRTGTSCFSKSPYIVRRWQHVVAVKKGEQMSLYVDGKLVAGAVDKTTLTAGLRLVAGRQSPSDSILPFSGQLDELALYNRALTADEIAAHYRLMEWTNTKDAATGRDDI